MGRGARNADTEGNNVNMITEQRRIALENPCQHAIQCADPKYFFHFHPAQGITCGVNLTINVGEE